VCAPISDLIGVRVRVGVGVSGKIIKSCEELTADAAGSGIPKDCDGTGGGGGRVPGGETESVVGSVRVRVRVRVQVRASVWVRVWCRCCRVWVWRAA